MTEANGVLDMLESVDLERLGSLDLDKLESLENIKEEVHETLNELDMKTIDRGDSLEAIVVALRKEVEELKSKGSNSEVAGLKREVELLNTELLEAALMWWRRRCNDVQCGNAIFETWQSSKFSSMNSSIQISSLSEEDGFFTFMDGLKPWAKNELRQQGVKELSIALTTTESIIELGIKKLDSKPKLSHQEKDGEGSETLKLDSILNTMEVKKSRKKKGLMFIDVNVAGQRLSTLVDPDTSELFMSEYVAKRLGLHVENQYIILVNRGPGVGAKVLFVIQVLKALCKEEPTFLAVLVCDEPATTKEVPDMVSYILAKFKDVMPIELPKKLPPKREEMRRQLKDLLDARYIRPSKSPYGAPMLFQKKHDGSLWICIDFQTLNKLTVNNKYPIPLIADLFDQLGGARWFTKLDLRSSYYPVRIVERDEPKTVCVTRYSSYEYLEMPFGLTNAPTTFFTLMSKVLQSFLDRFVVVYLDDIVIYSKTLEEYVEHLRDKIRAIDEWEVSTKVMELSSFLGLANYYQSRKLNETERRYTVHEKDMNVVVHCLCTWRHYLLGSKFVVFTDNVANSYFLTQKKLSLKQARWQEFLAEFDLSLEHKLGKVNSVADALCQRYDMELVSLPMGWMWEHIKEGLSHDLMQDKIEQRRPTGLLQALPIPEKPWESLFMDIIVGFPIFDGFSIIMVLVDRFSKYGTFIPTSKYGTFIPTSKVYPAEEAARLFLKYVVKY
ncbi:RNA-directed DNA polymerase-like protein [Hibiscus syriacus]|uniref:RNA-directed DNA polymerase-like protein n=1 Tax=Hibiscus syriacus TaxID=106335 RepID=A0A6A3CEJ5_HIBSY|nr:RNA-directed DNA polymerase-like protein [Hibiscus syriacus]